MDAPLSPTRRSTITREKERAQTDRSTLYDVLDAGLVCHLGLVLDGSPHVVPTGYGRDGDTLYLHGSTGAQSLRRGGPVCVTVTLLDGIVYARSVFNHSMNYRSAVIHGEARRLDDDEKLHALHVLSDHLAPGSWEHARLPSKKELAQTAVLALDLHEASVKLRTGAAEDEPEDLDLPVWAGVLPIRTAFEAPVSDPLLADGTAIPAHVERRLVGDLAGAQDGTTADEP